MEKFKKASILFLMCMLIVIVFSPALHNEFINWDDDVYVTRNAQIKDLSWRGLSEMFNPASSVVPANVPQLHVPLVTLSYALEYRFFGLNPKVYHFTNIILHVFNAALVFWLFLLLFGNTGVALLTAVFFAIHPLRVESVAWVTERKDVLYSFFFLGALICYVYYLKNKSLRLYAGVWVLFLLSFLSKPVAIILPVMLFVIDYIFQRRVDKRALLEKAGIGAVIIPHFIFYLINLPKFLITSIPHTMIEKLFIACYQIVFYLKKFFLPFDLSAYYASPLVEGKALPWEFFAAGATVSAIILMVIKSLRYTKKIAFGAMFFLVTLLPVLFMLSARAEPILVADRFIYFPSLGLSFIVAWLVMLVYDRAQKKYHFGFAVVACIVAIGAFLSVLTFKRNNVWKDSLALWTDVLKYDPDNATAYNNRGAELITRDHYEEARADLMTALQKDPSYHEAYFNLHVLAELSGNGEKSAELLKQALEINPGYKDAYDKLVMLLGRDNKHEMIVELSKEFIEVNSRYASAFSNMCTAYGSMGQYAAAVDSCEQALLIDPQMSSAHFNLSVAYFYLGKTADALSHCDKALSLGFKVPATYLQELKGFGR